MWLSHLTGEQKETMLRLAHNVIVSDGLLDPNEEGMLEAFRREMSVSSDFQIEYQELAGIEAVFSERKERLIVLMNLCKLSYADGAFEIEEECLIIVCDRSPFCFLVLFIQAWILFCTSLVGASIIDVLHKGMC